MKRNLLRMLALAGALSVASLANAGYWDQGKCYIYCSNGTTAGPYWSTADDCCADFERLCAGSGSAYTVFGTPPYQSILDCPINEHL